MNWLVMLGTALGVVIFYWVKKSVDARYNDASTAVLTKGIIIRRRV